ncbi:hypothetical protein D5S18_13330 [Nocardia panacis]|uniref:Uncharacterized protein n=1 Tax=Nocardia panacis TaxID=2340916 RepID=A0A3A4K013_9NOCA|nr:hypothetical protein [Nocardia panacis]RJO77135.1 hypothetical protein D5S18_13330 [Nocardia panacis]
MSGIYIEPARVKATGNALDALAVAAREQTDRYFESSAQVGADNPGFAAGPQLAAYATELHSQIKGFIDDLSASAKGIVEAAADHETVDGASAHALTSEFLALNGLAAAPLSGR